MNSNKKTAEWAAKQEEGQEGVKASGEINPCWITFWDMIYELDAERERLDAAEKAAQEAAAASGD